MDELKLELLAPAQWELEEIALVHLNLVGPSSTRKITDSIYDSLELLRSHPQMGVMMRDKGLRHKGYRMLICGNYLCIYRHIGDTVFIYHIADGRTDYPRLFDDLS